MANTKTPTPYKWLLNLNKAILNTDCKKNNISISLDDGTRKAGKIIQEKLITGSSIWWVGNGGSAAMCSHLSQDMLNKLSAKSMIISDPSLITCMANDFGYKNVYYRPLSVLSEPGDLLIAISSSGNSENILLCADMAIAKGMDIITLSGLDTKNRLWNMKSNLSFFVASNLYGIVEVAHEAILHSVIETLWLTKEDDTNV